MVAIFVIGPSAARAGSGGNSSIENALGLGDHQQGIDDVIEASASQANDFTWKVKIMLGFFQIVTNMAVALDVPWPAQFKRWVRVLDVINLDFLAISSTDCVVPTPYSARVAAAAAVPVFVLTVLLVGYLLPKYITSGARSAASMCRCCRRAGSVYDREHRRALTGA